jgi:hypothetical protein
MDRTALRTLCWMLLGVKETDPFYSVARVDIALNTAEAQLAEEIRRQAPDVLTMKVTLAADVSTGNVYTFSTQAPPITDFSEVLELRLTDRNGVRLEKASDEDLNRVSGGFYSIVGNDATPVIETDQGIAAGTPLYLKYARKTADWSAANASPESVPKDFHDVVGLVAVDVLFALGGEGRMPDDLKRVQIDRRGALWHHIGRRSPDAQLVRRGTADSVETIRR